MKNTLWQTKNRGNLSLTQAEAEIELFLTSQVRHLTINYSLTEHQHTCNQQGRQRQEEFQE